MSPGKKPQAFIFAKCFPPVKRTNCPCHAENICLCVDCLCDLPSLLADCLGRGWIWQVLCGYRTI